MAEATAVPATAAWMPWRTSGGEQTAAGASGSRRDRAWTVLAGIAVSASAALHVYIALGADTPTFPFDEVTLLEYARYYATGGGEITPVEGVGYFPAWSLVLAPLWWVVSDPAVFYRAAIWIGVACAILTIWPLAAGVRRLGLTTAQAVTVGALVMCLPSRVVQADYAMSEKPLFLAVAVVMLAAVRLWERPTVPRAVVFALLAVLMGFLHSRATVMLVACLIWLLLFTIRSRRAAIVGLLVAAPLGWLSYRYSIGLNDLLLQSRFNQGTNLTENLASARPSIILRVLLGQSWNQTVATLGVYLVGAVVLLCLIWFELRRERGIGPACLLGAMFLGISLVSVASWSSEESLYFAEWRRLDAWIYGRYVEPVTALLVAVGLAALVRGLRPGPVVAATVVAAGILVPTVLWVAPGAPTWAYVTPAHIGGVMPWFGLLPEGDESTWAYGLLPGLANDNRFWLVPTLLTAVALLGLLIAALRRVPPLVPTGVLLVAACVGSVAADPATDEFQEVEGGVPAVATQLRELETGYGPQEVDFDRSCTPEGANNNVAQNNVAYWILPGTMDVVFDPAEIDADLVVTCGDWPYAAEAGALRLAGEDSYGYRVWVLPGPLQEELAAEGRLEAAAG